MRVCNNFKPLPGGWDQPYRTNAVRHVTSVTINDFSIQNQN